MHYGTLRKKSKKEGGGKQVEWLVKFEGWPSKYNQWIPEKDTKDVSEDKDVTLRGDQ